MAIVRADTNVTLLDGTEQTLWTSPAGELVTRLSLDFNAAGAACLLMVRFQLAMDTGGPIASYATELDIDALGTAGQTGWQTDDMACANASSWTVEQTAGSAFNLQWEVYTT